MAWEQEPAALRATCAPAGHTGTSHKAHACLRRVCPDSLSI